MIEVASLICLVCVIVDDGHVAGLSRRLTTFTAADYVAGGAMVPAELALPSDRVVHVSMMSLLTVTHAKAELRWVIRLR